MAGKIKAIISEIIEKRSQGNTTIATVTRAKILLKGINPDKYTSESDDDPAVIEKLKSLAESIGVSI